MEKDGIGGIFEGRYSVVRCIGTGGMGTVYLATDPRYHDFEVAIKVLYPGVVKNPALRERFKNEIIASYNVLHRNVVRAYEYFDEGGSPAYVMEYVEGEDLYSRISKGKISYEDAVKILYQSAAGLAAIHAAGIMHRDLKPENIFLNRYGDVKIGDFGVARLKSEDISVTQSGILVGTPKYFAPEYIESGYCDARADIYALGVIAYEVVTGVSPFRSQTVNSIMLERFENKVKPIKELTTGCSQELINIIEKAMALNINSRYQDANQLKTDLALLMHGKELTYATKQLKHGRSEQKHNDKVIKEFKKKHNLQTAKEKHISIFVLLVLVFSLAGIAGLAWYVNMSMHEAKVGFGIEAGEYNGFLIEGERYKNFKLLRNKKKIIISIPELGCKNVTPDKEQIIECNEKKYQFKVDVVKTSKISGEIVDMDTESVKAWSAMKR